MTTDTTDEFRPTWREQMAASFWRHLANRLPRQLCYWAASRLLAHACTGPHWRDQDPHTLTFETALRRWHHD
jgi:hypothetical protein